MESLQTAADSWLETIIKYKDAFAAPAPAPTPAPDTQPSIKEGLATVPAYVWWAGAAAVVLVAYRVAK